ncbi:hypothetical protein ABNF97_21760 [Plantactinospora sp. B6F1]
MAKRTLRRAADMFPYLPQRPGHNKRLRAALPLIKKVIRDRISELLG